MSQLVDAVFMSGRAGAMFGVYPQYFSEANNENHFVFVDGGRVVSHFGMDQRDVSIAGCRLRVGCVGAVATYEEYRGKGLATRLFDATRDKAIADGVDFLLISGGRGLYRRAGAADVGCDAMTVLSGECAARLPGREAELRKLSAADLAGCAAAYDRKPTRFVRPEGDWTSLLESGKAMGRGADVTVVCDGGTCLGYFALSKTKEDGVLRVDEFAGEPDVLVGALAQLMAQRDCRGLEMRLQVGDAELRALIEAAGASFKTVATGGTLLVLRFAHLVERLRPHFEARVDAARAATLWVAEDDGKFTFGAGDDTFTVDRAGAATAIFGHPEAKPALGVWGEVLPAPTLWYGLNYT
ncbi:MAG: GNAT family N-acetyltransferase [Nitrospiraceae bacterium]|nr:GNAT family N-acetyltransferase [Nitrospiraceae bacterium]